MSNQILSQATERIFSNFFNLAIFNFLKLAEKKSKQNKRRREKIFN
jgi:hypothetical protein